MDIFIIMKKIVITLQEKLDATRPNVYTNKKKYKRNSKHKGDGSESNKEN